MPLHFIERTDVLLIAYFITVCSICAVSIRSINKRRKLKSSQSYLARGKLDALTDIQDAESNSPLHIACQHAHPKMLRYFLEEMHLNPSITNARGYQPLHVAVLSELHDPSGAAECISILLQYGAAISAADTERGNTAIHIAANKNFAHSMKALLLNTKVPLEVINAKNKRTKTALHLSAQYDDTVVMELLLNQEGIEVDSKDHKNATPLHLSAINGNSKTATLLLSKGADPNAVDIYGNAPLHYAVQEGHEYTTTVLIKKGADPNLMNLSKKTPLHLGVENGQEDCCIVLTSNGADVSIRYQYGLLVGEVKHRQPYNTDKKKSIMIRQRDGNNLLGKEDVEMQLLKQCNRYGYLEFDENGKEIKKYKLNESYEHKKTERDTKRAAKWAKMILNWDNYMKKNPKKIKSRVAKGFPESLRPEGWRLLSNAKSKKEANPGLYQQLMVQQTKSVEQIDLDINRSYRNHIQFRERFGPGQVALFNILKACAVYDKELGYCQGMCDITAFLLMYIPEEDTFWVLVQLLQDPKYNLRGRFLAGFPLLYQSFYIHEKLTEKFAPKVAAHLKKENLSSEMYAFRWFMLVFLDAFPFPIMVRLWDLFLYYGYDIVYTIAIAVFKMFEAEILKMSFESIMQMLKGLEERSDLDPDQFIKFVLKNKIPRKEIQKLEQMYEKNPER